MNIKIAENEDQIRDCCGVMAQLRTHLAEDELAARIGAQMRQGYRLAYVVDQGRTMAVAGFRIGENLAWGRFMYVDDLVTVGGERSKGYGGALLEWLENYAKQEKCAQLHLDSGMPRVDAHRFYDRQAYIKTGFHFAKQLS